MPQEPIRQGAEEQIFGVSVHQVAEEKKVEVPKISREPASCSIEQVAQCETVSHDRIQQRCVKRLDPVEKLSDDQKWTLSDASQRPLGRGSGEGC